ncbi:MAG: prohibitin family protein [Bacteroidales bacterium]|nr:prohibitin family protein [Bacteroidales bacterium]MBN2757896.1 prohibitin family protein [Bacteroidales bacterium]
MKKQLSATFIVVIVIGVIAIIILSSNIFYTLQPGEKGILFKPLSNELDKVNVYGVGLHIVAPWNEMIIYDVKEQKVDETMDILDKNGLSVHVDISVRFNPMFDKIGFLHEKFGVNYVNKLVIPEVRSEVRKVMGRFAAEEIYSTRRAEVEAEIVRETDSVLRNNQNNIDLKAVLIRSIAVPEKIKESIEKKLRAEQESLAYIFILQKEKSEAERKIIAAEGEAKANKVINSSLTPELLKMRGIEATLQLANSPNSKVIVVGSSKDGLPLILGNN